jgi:hypothetical protein
VRALVWRGLDAPRGERVVHSSSGGFEADIEFDADRLVTLYHDFLERID